MSEFIENPTNFSAQCACHGGRCEISRRNFLFLDDGNELAAIDRLHNRCGHVVVIPGLVPNGRAWLYHTSCQRMTDVVKQIFEHHLGEPATLPHTSSSEMTLGALYRRALAMPYDRCRVRVESFTF